MGKSLVLENVRKIHISIVFLLLKRVGCIDFYSLATNLNISIEIFKYELLQVKYLFLQSLKTAK